MAGEVIILYPSRAKSMSCGICVSCISSICIFCRCSSRSRSVCFLHVDHVIWVNTCDCKGCALPYLRRWYFWCALRYIDIFGIFCRFLLRRRVFSDWLHGLFLVLFCLGGVWGSADFMFVWPGVLICSAAIWGVSSSSSWVVCVVGGGLLWLHR